VRGRSDAGCVGCFICHWISFVTQVRRFRCEHSHSLAANRMQAFRKRKMIIALRACVIDQQAFSANAVSDWFVLCYFSLAYLVLFPQDSIFINVYPLFTERDPN
jgi:hypothetical protein